MKYYIIADFNGSYPKEITKESARFLLEGWCDAEYVDFVMNMLESGSSVSTPHCEIYTKKDEVKI